jgi:hypothetical protein
VNSKFLALGDFAFAARYCRAIKWKKLKVKKRNEKLVKKVNNFLYAAHSLSADLPQFSLAFCLDKYSYSNLYNLQSYV